VQPQGISTIEITYNGGEDVTADGVTVTFHGPAILLSLFPESGPVYGGTPVVITGDRFEFLETLRCVFGGNQSVVKAVFINTTAVVCVSPPSRFGPGDTTVSVLTSPLDTPLSVDGEALATLSFTYTRPAAVKAVFPVNSPIYGGVTISVMGDFLGTAVSGSGVPLDSVLCQFGSSDVFVVPSLVTPTRVDCVAPARSVGPHTVSISTNGGVDFPPSPVELVYILPTRVFNIAPVLGPEAGGTVVTVLGAYFVPSRMLSCRFRDVQATVGDVLGSGNFSRGSPIVPATFVSPSIVQCVAPAVSYGVSSVEVSNNGFDFSFDVVEYLYHLPVYLSSLSQSHGPAAGGTAVTIFGDRFLDTVTTQCRFGNLTVPALFVSNQVIQCSTPEHPVGPVPVDVSLNGVDFTSAYTLQYEFDMDQFVTGVQPYKGPVSGGTVVTVQVAHVENVTTLSCKFRGVIVPATYLSPSSVSCVSPVSPLLDGITNGAGTIAVEVSENGEDYTNSQRQFLYELDAQVSGVSLSHLPEGQSVLLTVVGSGFVSSPGLLCMFTHSQVLMSGLFDVTPEPVVVAARFISSQELQCVLPSGPIGFWTVDVSNNGQQFTSSSVRVYVVEPMSVWTLYPSTGPSWGGTRVYMRVANLPAIPGTLRPLCRFNTTQVPAFVDPESGMVSCVTPPADTPVLFDDLAVASVDISTNGGWHFTSSGLVFLYTPMPLLESGWATPHVGGTEGGTLITLTTAGASSFSGAVLPRCRFGNVNGTNYFVVPATVSPTNPTVLTCVTPPHPVGLTTVSVSMNGADFAPSGARFLYVLSPRVTSLLPLSGLETGGDLLTLSGINFLAVDTLVCKFQTSYPTPVEPLDDPVLPVVTLVPALWLSSTQLQCITPPTLPSVVTVEVSVNGFDFSSDRIQYTFLQRPILIRITPLASPIAGGIPVSVYSNGFTESVKTTCRFGVYDVIAAYVSRFEVRCMAPPQPPALCRSRSRLAAPARTPPRVVSLLSTSRPRWCTTSRRSAGPRWVARS